VGRFKNQNPTGLVYWKITMRKMPFYGLNQVFKLWAF